MNDIRSLCLYCGSRPGLEPAFAQAATSLGTLCGQSGIRLVYGGGSIGLMGLAARAALAAGGHVIGIIPKHLDRVEIAMKGLTELHVVSSMHERKHRMFEESDAFVVLPGGTGTLDEFIEVTTWAQLGLHQKPIILVNINDYWQPLLALFDHIVAADFTSPQTRDLFHVVDSIDAILPLLARLPAPTTPPAPDKL